jgi:hypothetical protein
MDANDRQVGGTHYQKGYQHWDLVADFNLGYFPGQITKYITRHTRKNKRQDVEKALHFLDKWAEVTSGTNPLMPAHDPLPRVTRGAALLAMYADDNELEHEETQIIIECCLVRGAKCIPTVREHIETILARYLVKTVNVHFVGDPEPTVIGDAGPGYVNQDR